MDPRRALAGQQLEREPGAEEPHLHEFQSIISSLENLPAYTESTPERMSLRQREKEVAAELARAEALRDAARAAHESLETARRINRERLQNEFLRLQAMLRKTIVFITHDFDEAIRLADRIAIMKDGEIIHAAFLTPNWIGSVRQPPRRSPSMSAKSFVVVAPSRNSPR